MSEELAALFADDSPRERLTPPEKWTNTAKVVVLLTWHAEHPGCYLSHEEAARALAEACQRPMPTITLAEICAASWEIGNRLVREKYGDAPSIGAESQPLQSERQYHG